MEVELIFSQCVHVYIIIAHIKIDKVVLELQEKAVQALKSLKSVKEEQRFNFSPYMKDSRKRSALCGSSWKFEHQKKAKKK